MTVSLTSSFFKNARGLTLKDSATVTWAINKNTNEISATGSGGGGGLTSVGFADASGTPIYTVTNSPLVANGTLTITLNNQSANRVFAGPTTGAAAQPTFRALVLADIPTGYPYSSLSGAPAIPSGTVTSVGLTVNATYIAIGGTASPITSSGTFTLDLSTAAKANLALAATALQVAPFTKVAGWNSSSGAIVVGNTVSVDVLIPFACTLKQIYIMTQGGTGSCTVTAKTAAFPTTPATDITGGTPPAISSGTSYSNAVLSGWTTSFAQGDLVRFQLTANTTFTSVTIYFRAQ